MIAEAVTHIAGELNQHLKRTSGSSEDAVVVTSINNPDGSQAPRIENRIALFLVNVERDTVAHTRSAGAAQLTRSSFPAVFLNLHVMVAAHYGSGNYVESLKSLSRAVSFFQGKPLMDRSSSPDLPDGIDKLILELETLSIHDLSNLWGMLGGSYVPSALYKVRMAAFLPQHLRGVVPAARKPEPAIGAGA